MCLCTLVHLTAARDFAYVSESVPSLSSTWLCSAIPSFLCFRNFFFLTGKRKKDGGRKSIFRARELSELTSENSCHSPAQNSTCDWGLGTFVGQASVLWKLLIPDPYLTYFLFFFKKIFFKKNTYLCVCTCEYICSHRPEEDIRSPWTSSYR